MMLYDIIVMIVWYIYVNVGYEWYHLETTCVKSFHLFWGDNQTDSNSMNDMIWYDMILCYNDIVWCCSNDGMIYIYVDVGYDWYHLETDCVKSFHSFWGNSQTDSNNSNEMIWYDIML